MNAIFLYTRNLNPTQDPNTGNICPSKVLTRFYYWSKAIVSSFLTKNHPINYSSFSIFSVFSNQPWVLVIYSLFTSLLFFVNLILWTLMLCVCPFFLFRCCCLKMQIWRTMDSSIRTRNLKSRMLILRTNTTTPKVFI